MQQAIAASCGDRPSPVGDYAAIKGSLDYPCKIDMSAERIAAAAEALRSNASLLPLLRLRVADIRTRLNDLTVNNKDILDGLREVASQVK